MVRIFRCLFSVFSSSSPQAPLHAVTHKVALVLLFDGLVVMVSYALVVMVSVELDSVRGVFWRLFMESPSWIGLTHALSRQEQLLVGETKDWKSLNYAVLLHGGCLSIYEDGICKSRLGSVAAGDLVEVCLNSESWRPRIEYPIKGINLFTICSVLISTLTAWNSRSAVKGLHLIPSARAAAEHVEALADEQDSCTKPLPKMPRGIEQPCFQVFVSHDSPVCS